MIDTDTACLLLEYLYSDNDEIWLQVPSGELQTTPRDLMLNDGFDHRTPANRVGVRFLGGIKKGGYKYKTGTLFTMVMDRITFG